RERGDVRRRATADENPRGFGWIPDPLLEPVQNHELELAWTGGRHPRADVDVQRARDQITERARERTRRRDECEVARMREPAHRSQNVVRGLLQELRPIAWLGGRWPPEPLPERAGVAAAHRRNRAIGQLV